MLPASKSETWSHLANDDGRKLYILGSMSHRIGLHEMWTAVMDEPDVKSVSLFVTRAGCAQTSERINVRFGIKTSSNPGNNTLYGDEVR